MFPTFRFIQKAIICKDNKYLTIKRSDYSIHNPFKWDLPGGKVQFGEDIAEALKREVQEETSISVNINSPLIVHSFMWKDIYVIGVIYDCEYIKGDVKLSDEHTDYQWVEKQDLAKMDFVDWILDAFELKNGK